MANDGGLRALHRVESLASGDAEGLSKGKAFLTRFLKTERRIFAYIFRLLPSRADAEDVLQEVSMIMWEKFDESYAEEDFVAWACRIAYYKVKDHRRSERRRRVIFSDAMLERVAQTMSEHAATLQLDRRQDALACCLGKLGRGDRELLASRFQEGATARSVAESVGRSVDGVYKSLTRIRRVLLACIERTLAAEGHA